MDSSGISQIDYDDSDSCDVSRPHSEYGFGSGFGSFHHDINDSPYHKVHHHQKSNKKKLDFAFLYADPLVERVKNELLPINAPLDTEIEFREIFKIL